MNQKQLADEHLLRDEALFANQLPSKDQKQSSKSQMFEKYLIFLGLERGDEIDRQRKRKQLKNIVNSERLMLRDNWIANMKLKFLEESRKRDFFSLLVFFGYFRIIVNVLIKDEESPIHSIGENSSGNFANIYRVNLFGKETAIKCNHFKLNNIGDDSESFQAGFSKIIKQYVSFLIASKLEAGPHMHSPCGFDLFIYRNCIEFMMEYCEQDLHLCSNIQEDLIEGLKRLHCLNIVHFDIKTENICYSHKYKKGVFIDFGLSEAIKENPGSKTFMPFRGSYSYCSQQMVRCFSEGPIEVDAYYNDIFCLQQSFKQIKQNKLAIFQHQELIPTNLSNNYIFDLVRFYLLQKDEQKYQENSKFFKRFNRYLLKKYLKNLRQELKQRSISSFSKYVGSYCYSYIKQKEMRLKQHNNHWRFIVQQQNSEHFQKNTMQIRRSSQIKQLCQSSKLSVRSQIKKFLMQESSALQLVWQDSEYTLILAQNIKIQSNKFSYEQKLGFASVSLRRFSEQEHANDIQKCIEAIFDYVFQSDLSTLKLDILQQIIISVVVFETKSQQQIVDSFNKIIDFEGQPYVKTRTIVRYLTAISWIRFKTISNYSFRYLEDQMWVGVKRYLKAANSKEENKQMIKLLQFFQNIRQYQNIQQIIKCNNVVQGPEKKFLKRILILDTFTLEHQIYIKHLQLLSKYQSENRCQVIQEDFERGLFNYMLYEKNSFHFALFQLNKIYGEGDSCIQSQFIFQRYHNFFHQYKFYKHFQIYMTKQISQILSNRNFIQQDEQNVKAILINLSEITKKSIFRQKMTYNFCLLKIMEMFNLEYEEVINILRIEKGFWKQQLLFLFKNNHLNSSGGHSLNQKVKFCLYFILQQLGTKTIARMNQNEVINELHDYFTVMGEESLKLQCFQCRSLMFLQARVVQIIILYLEKRITLAFNLTFELICSAQKDILLLNKQLHEEIIKYAQPSCQLILLYFESARVSERINIINYRTLINLFTRIYMELHRRSRFDDIFWLLDHVFQYLQKAIKKAVITQFLGRMKLMINMFKQNKEDQLYFFESHLQLIQLWRHSSNPYIAVFLIIFLQSRVTQLRNSFIYAFITRALNNLDPLSKELILRTYFKQFYTNFSPLPMRKERNLIKRDQKHQSKPFTLQKYLRVQLSINYYKELKLFPLKSQLIKKFIAKCHQNVGNLKQ